MSKDKLSKNELDALDNKQITQKLDENESDELTKEMEESDNDTKITTLSNEEEQ